MGEDPKAYFLYKNLTFQGTLPNIYNKLRKSYAQVGLIQLNKRRRTDQEGKKHFKLLFVLFLKLKSMFSDIVQEELDSDEDYGELTENPSTFIDEAISFLETNVNDVDKIKSYWRLSHKWRKNELKNSSICDIFNKFPCLQTVLGPELVSHKNVNYQSKIFCFQLEILYHFITLIIIIILL